MRLLLIEDDQGPKVSTARFWDGSCTLVPVHQLSELRDHDPRTIDGIVMGPAVSPGIYQEAVDTCASHKLPLLLLGSWHETLLRHARSRHNMVVHFPEKRALALTGEQLGEAVTSARSDRHRPRARAVIGAPTLRTVVRAILEEQGFKPEVHDTLSSARSAARTRHAPDVTVVDAFLPDGNGLTLLPTRPNPRAAPVVLLSPSIEPWIIEEAQRRGAHAVLTTPLDPNALTRELAGVARRERASTRPSG